MYLVLGNFLGSDHERAIRFVDQAKAIDRGLYFGKGKTKTEWCDKCACWHVTAPMSLNTPQSSLN